MVDAAGAVDRLQIAALVPGEDIADFERGDDITGRTVVVSSRLCDLAPAASIYVSSTTVDLVSGRGIAVTCVT